ncbi:MAG TPA: hypothetical protein VD999_06835 [Vitreimonas sp.]|nr:hypothetical protein [Vitreimonas sp.]
MHKEQLSVPEILIHPHRKKTLNQQITETLQQGMRRIYLEGEFCAPEPQFSFLSLNSPDLIEIIGNGHTVINGEGQTAHLVFVGDQTKLKLSGIHFTGGNTQDLNTLQSLTNHPQQRLNIFRYLDGAAITMGMGSQLSLENCVFSQNSSAICGGAISNLGGHLHAYNCRFESNTAGDTGAAIDNLAAGSLSIIDNCHFIHNEANQLGEGNSGAITAFPDTYLIVKDCDFFQSCSPAVDYRPNAAGRIFTFVHRSTTLNKDPRLGVIKNPVSNASVKKEILRRYLQLLTTHPTLVKLQAIPKASKNLAAQHWREYQQLIDELTV